MLGLKLNHVSKRGPRCLSPGIWFLQGHSPGHWSAGTIDYIWMQWHVCIWGCHWLIVTPWHRHPLRAMKVPHLPGHTGISWHPHIWVRMHNGARITPLWYHISWVSAIRHLPRSWRREMCWCHCRVIMPWVPRTPAKLGTYRGHCGSCLPRNCPCSGCGSLSGLAPPFLSSTPPGLGLWYPSFITSGFSICLPYIFANTSSSISFASWKTSSASKSLLLGLPLQVSFPSQVSFPFQEGLAEVQPHCSRLLHLLQPPVQQQYHWSPQ